MIQGQEGAEHLAYWRKQLEGELPKLVLPTDHPKTDNMALTGQTVTVALGERLTQRMRHFRLQHPVHHSTIFLATLKTLLYRYSGQKEMVVGLKCQGQTQRVDQTMVFFTTVLPIRSRVCDSQPFIHLVNELGHTVEEGEEHMVYPLVGQVFDRCIQKFQSTPVLSQVVFGYQECDHVDDEHCTCTEHFARKVSGGYTCPPDFAVDVDKSDNDFNLHFKYNSALFDADTINLIIGHYLTLLQNMLANPYRPLCQYPCLSVAQQQAMSKQGHPRQQNLHQLVATRV